MKKALFVVLLAVAVGGITFLAGRGEEETPNYRLAQVERGDLEALVSATGTLDAVTTVQVGTQVSGIIDEITVDFNDPVVAGQVVARIDTTLLANAVAGAGAQLARSEAELRHAEREHARVAALHEEGLASESEFHEVLYQLDVAAASVRSAEVDLARTRQNLSYATITSPIDGTVIDRPVDVGQTVQASFSAPELFLIAGDLASLQILVSVDESDIGRISEGQDARFTVQAYPEETFTGTVRQVRLQSSTEENVVNYTAVIDAANPDGRLLPGMTATVDFLVETASDVLYVSNAALRYRPGEEAMAEALRRLRAEREERGEGPAGRAPGGAGGATEGARAQSDDRASLWSLDENGDLVAIPVRTGITDGVHTVVRGRDLEEGRAVIAGMSSRSAAAAEMSSPFQTQRESRPPGPPSPGGF